MQLSSRLAASFGTVAALLLYADIATAEWLNQPVTPRSAAELERTFRVSFKDAGETTRCEIIVASRRGTDTGPIRAWSNGSLYMNPAGLAPTELPRERGKSVPMIEKRSGQTITYRFEAPRRRLSELRFEFWDSASSSPETLGGGTIYWFNLRDFREP